MKDCNNCKHEDCWEYAEPCSSCTTITGEPTNWQPQTNSERLRVMTDEELAVICEYGCPPNHECPPINREEIGKRSACQQCWLDWLKQEATE